jgi:hypothetical protein
MNKTLDEEARQATKTLKNKEVDIVLRHRKEKCVFSFQMVQGFL